MCKAIIPLQAQRIDAFFILDGVKREFIVHKPTGAVPAGGYPIVMMLHGTTGDGEKFYNISGWKELGEKEKILTIYPSSLSFCVIGDLGFKVNETKWNNGDLQENKCPNLVQDFKDDVKFIKKVIDTVQKVFNINQKMIFLSGFSNGSAMANKLAIEGSDVFAAVASSAAKLFSLDSAKPKRYIPVWQTFGTNDEHLTAYNNGLELPFNDSLRSILKPLSQSLLGAMNLDTASTIVKNSMVFTYTFTKPKSNTQKNYYYYSFMKGLDHIYPNGVNYPISNPVIFWEFFKQAVATTPTDNLVIPAAQVKSYPNPSHDMVTIELPLSWRNKPGRVEVYNALGEKQVIKKMDVFGPVLTLNKSELGPGVYFAVISNGFEKAVTKIILN
jgi:polyhydroxybutyrate depolymerase